MKKKIKAKERDAIIQSLKAGVTPRIGLQHIQVGRKNEITTIIKDLSRITEGGTTFRLFLGSYGSGKTFLLQLIRVIALEKGLVTINADLSPDRRLYATQGHARHLYSELMQNMATRTKPNGNALSSIVERFISSSLHESEVKQISPTVVIRQKLSSLTEYVGGFDFAKVIASYWQGHESDCAELKENAIRWLRAEFSTKTEAKKTLGVHSIISDANIYDHLKLMGFFVKLAGYNGLLVCLDELVNLYKLSHRQTRLTNYEKILQILNDSLQGVSEFIGFFLAGTPEFLLDTHRGLYSYEALQSRLAINQFAQKSGVADFSSPTLFLENLQPEDIFILLKNIRNVYASGDEDKYLISDDGLTEFMQYCSTKIGDAYFRTPRNTIRAFTDILSLLEQNKKIKWKDLLGNVKLTEDNSEGISTVKVMESDKAGELSTFTL